MSRLRLPLLGGREAAPVFPLDSQAALDQLLVREKTEPPMFCYGPTYYHKLLPLLADEEPTLDRPVPYDIPPPISDLGSEVARVAINDYLNTCFTPARAAKDSWNFTSTIAEDDERPDACSLAEEFLIDTFNSMEDVVAARNSDRSTSGPDWTIIADEDLEPIAIRKHRGTPSALSLAPITINGRKYPAGSLLGVQLRKERRENPNRCHTGTGSVTSNQNIASIRFLRLSAFAHSHEERIEVFGYTNFDSLGGTLSIDQITDLAKECIPLSERFGFPEEGTKGKMTQLLTSLGKIARREISTN